MGWLVDGMVGWLMGWLVDGMVNHGVESRGVESKGGKVGWREVVEYRLLSQINLLYLRSSSVHFDRSDGSHENNTVRNQTLIKLKLKLPLTNF